MKRVIAIAGPTAIGKSAVSVALAEKLKCDIISCDIMQSYIGFDVGTAKITDGEMHGIKHYMINEFSPEQNISVADFTKKALLYIKNCLCSNENIILAGGSGLYLDSMMYSNYSFEELPMYKYYEKKFYEEAAEYGKEYIYNKLLSCDSEYADITHPNNIKRVVGALAYYETAKEKKSNKKREEKTERFDCEHYFVLETNRPYLYAKINNRVDEMVNNGLFEEVDKLCLLYKNYNLNAFKAIGYKEIIEYFNGNVTKQEAIDLIKKNSRHYAKRQITWFNSNPKAVKIQIDSETNIDDVVEYIYKKVTNED